MSLPIVILCMAAITVKYQERQMRATRDVETEKTWASKRSETIGLGILALELVYSPVCLACFEIFHCQPFLGEGKKKAGGSMAYLKQEFGKLISGVGKYGKMFIDFIMSQIGKFGNFLKDGFHRFIDDFPLMNIKKIKFLPSALRFASNRIPGFGGLKKFQDSGDGGRQLANSVPLPPLPVGGSTH